MAFFLISIMTRHSPCKGQVLAGSEEYGALAGADDRCVDVLAEKFDAQEED